MRCFNTPLIAGREVWEGTQNPHPYWVGAKHSGSVPGTHVASLDSHPQMSVTKQPPLLLWSRVGRSEKPSGESGLPSLPVRHTLLPFRHGQWRSWREQLRRHSRVFNHEDVSVGLVGAGIHTPTERECGLPPLRVTVCHRLHVVWWHLYNILKCQNYRNE